MVHPAEFFKNRYKFVADPGTLADDEWEKNLNQLVPVKLYTGLDWKIKGALKQNLDILLNDLATSDMDVVIVIDGHEGTGKSFDGRAIARYAATFLRRWFPKTKFDVSDITWDTTKYVKDSLEAGRPDANNQRVKINLLDEGRNALNKRRSLSKSNVVFTNYLSECRDYRQVHIIILPAFHDLDKNVALWRTSMLIHTIKAYTPLKSSISGVKLVRGGFKLYTDKANIARYYDIPYYYPPKNECQGYFFATDVFTPEEYDLYLEKKREATIAKYGDQVDELLEQDKPAEEQIGASGKYIKVGDFGKRSGFSKTHIRKLISDKFLKAHKVKSRWLIDWDDFQEKLKHDKLKSEVTFFYSKK